MAEQSAIGWTDGTFNPWWGCVEVSPACDNCYAREWDARFGGDHWGKDEPRRFFPDKHWNEPRKWNRKAAAEGKRFLVFCASMADVFENRDDLEPWRQKLWTLIRETPALTWLLLTKRPQFIGRMLPEDLRGAPNIWLGTTIESPEYLWRAETLAKYTWARVRFLSMEPLLERVEIGDVLSLSVIDGHGRVGIDWVITGCESGDGARETQTDWYRSLRNQCDAYDVPFFFKQAPLGAEGVTEGAGSKRKRDLRTGPDGIKRVHWIVGEPYLDGVQHVAWPAVTP